MRILMLGWELPPHNSGGLGVACYELAKALAGNGSQIEFVLPHARNPDEPKYDFMRVHYAAKPNGVPQPVAATAYTQDFDAVQTLQRSYTKFVMTHLNDLQPDVIHAHDWLTFEAGIAAKKMTGQPLVAHVHATEFDRAGGNFGNPAIHEIERLGLLLADRIVAVSEATKQLIIQRYHIPAEKIDVVHNSVNHSELVASSTVQPEMYAYVRRLQAEGYTAVVTVGRLTIQKGLVHFLRAAQAALTQYGRLVFVVAGDGELKHELVRLSADLGISRHVLFTGFVRGQAWRELFLISDVFVMNSVSEPFGLTALEAAATGNAVLLSRTSGVGEVLTNVLKHDYWDAARLADEIVAVATSRALKQELVDGARSDSHRVSWQRAAELCRAQYGLVGARALS